MIFKYVLKVRFIVSLALIIATSNVLPAQDGVKNHPSRFNKSIDTIKRVIKKNKNRIAAFVLPAVTTYVYLSTRSPFAMQRYSTHWLKTFRNASFLKKLTLTYSPTALGFIGIPVPSFLDRNYLIASLNKQEMKQYLKIEAIVISCCVGLVSVLCLEAYKAYKKMVEQQNNQRALAAAEEPQA